jgi:hypothetical protein
MSESFDNDPSARVAAFQAVYFHQGWSRHLPMSAIMLFFEVVKAPRTRAELHDRLAAGWGSQGLDGPAFEPLKQWTEESLAELRAGPAFFDDDEDDDISAADVMAEEAEQRDQHIAQLDGYAVALGVAPVRTMGNVLDFMAACGVLTITGPGEDGLFNLNPHASLPSEALPIAPEQRRHEDRMRWAPLHAPTVQAITDMFDPDAEQPATVRRTNLERLAQELGTDTETVRAGLVCLLEQPDFTASADIERVREHQVFEITVDWDTFARTRITIMPG